MEHFSQQAAEQAAAAIAALLEESTSETTPHARRREIEQQLLAYHDQRAAWRFALFFLETSSSALVHWYAASALEHVVRHRWMQLEPAERAECIAFVAQHLQAKHATLSHFSLIKLLSVFVCIGLAETSSGGTAFMDNLLAWCTQRETASLGFTCIKIWSEEMREHGSQEQKTFFISKASDIKSVIFHYLGTLHIQLQKGMTSSSGEPGNSRPLPSTPQASPSDKMFGTSQVQSIEIPNSCFDTAGVALDALTSLFSWIDIDKILTGDVFEVLQAFAAPSQPDHSLGRAALRCFNEIHQQHRVPQQLFNYILAVYDLTGTLLSSITHPGGGVCPLDQTLDYEYIDALVEYVRLFLTNYLKRLLPDTSLNHAATVQALTDFIDFLTDPDLFGHAIEALHDFVLLLVNDELGLFPQAKEQCQAALIRAVQMFGARVQASCSPMAANISDKTHPQSEEPTEFQEHVQTIGLVVADIGRLYPQPVLEMLSSSMRTSISNIVQATMKSDTSQIELLLRDFDASCRLFAMCSDVAVEYFVPFYGFAPSLLKDLVSFLDLSQPLGAYFGRVLQPTLLAFGACMPWLFTLGKFATQPNSEQAASDFMLFVEMTTQLARKSLTLGDDHDVLLLAAYLVGSFAQSVRLRAAFLNASVQELFALLDSNWRQFPAHVAGRILGAVCRFYAVAWKDSKFSEQSWEQRLPPLRAHVASSCIPSDLHGVYATVAVYFVLAEEKPPKCDDVLQVMTDKLRQLVPFAAQLPRDVQQQIMDFESSTL